MKTAIFERKKGPAENWAPRKKEKKRREIVGSEGKDKSMEASMEGKEVNRKGFFSGQGKTPVDVKQRTKRRGTKMLQKRKKRTEKRQLAGRERSSSKGWKKKKPFRQ